MQKKGIDSGQVYPVYNEFLLKASPFKWSWLQVSEFDSKFMKYRCPEP